VWVLRGCRGAPAPISFFLKMFSLAWFFYPHALDEFTAGLRHRVFAPCYLRVWTSIAAICKWPCSLQGLRGDSPGILEESCGDETKD
jgi:hypothetical protein